jgi:hypothetical protein
MGQVFSFSRPFLRERVVLSNEHFSDNQQADTIDICKATYKGTIPF